MADDDVSGNVSVQVDEPPDAPVEAPYGWMNDSKTGVRRPRKAAGRAGMKKAAAPPAATKSLDELKAAGPIQRGQDRAPSGKGAPATSAAKDDEPAPLPPFRAGPIAKGMNKLYRRAGKIVKAMDRDIGIAIIEATKKEAEDDVTVGEAWEEIAKTNPRIRRVLLKMVEGGAWMQLFWAHAPIFLAILMKEQIAKHIPFAKIISAVSSLDDEDEETDEPSSPRGGGSLPFGLKPDDVNQMMTMFGPALAQMGANGPRAPGGPPRAPVSTVNGADGEGPAP